MSNPRKDSAPGKHPEAPPPSWGNMSEDHWSRSRKGTNQEAIEYYRDRSHAPGVEAGGAERNFYCMRCDGVIPHGEAIEACPHCGAELEDRVRRYFNWVEIDEPRGGDARAMLPLLIGALAVALALIVLVVWLIAGRGA